MNRFALLAFYRSLVRHRLYAAINIGGLAVGIAVFLVLGIYVRFETSYETWLPHHDQVYLVEAKDGSSIGDRPSQATPIALWPAIDRDLPGIAGTRIEQQRATVIKGGVGVSETLAQVDPDFTNLFDLPVVAGSMADVFADPANIVVTQRTADKYLGGGNPIGKPMTIAFEGMSHVYRVAAVVKDLPANTELEFDMLVRKIMTEDETSAMFKADHQWNYYNTSTYVRVPDAAAATRLTTDLVALADRHAQSETPDNKNVEIHLSLRPIAAVHFETAGQTLAVTTLGIVGLLTLLIAIVNYVNLATARAGLRAREVAMRKVLGADRRTLVRHYVGEAIGTTAIAAFVGLALAEARLPLVSAASGLALSIHYIGTDGVLLPLVLLVGIVGALSGVYPALLLSRFPAAAVLASARSPGGGRAGARVREGLVVFQFAIAIAFVVGTMVLVAQTAHVRAADLGYQRDGLLLVPSLSSESLNDAQRDTIVHRLAQLPGVSAVSVANNVPGPNGVRMETGIAVPGIAGTGPSFRFFETTPGFFQVVGARLVAGRVFDLAHPGDVNPNIADKTGDGNLPNNIVINRTAAATMRFASPQAAIGKTVGGGQGPVRTIIGVVDDMRFESPRDPIPPTIYDFQQRDPDGAVAIARFTGDPKQVTDAAQKLWREEAPEVPFKAKTAAQSLDSYYARDDHAAHLFTIGATLAVAIGCIGLWGLASFNTARRVREIGIRKTLGASSTDVVKLLVGQFLRPVLIANLFAWPLAYVAMRTWLAGFDDRIALSPLYFAAASVLALAIAVLTVLAQSLRAARAAPAWALRHD